MHGRKARGRPRAHLYFTLGAFERDNHGNHRCRLTASCAEQLGVLQRQAIALAAWQAPFLTGGVELGGVPSRLCSNTYSSQAPSGGVHAPVKRRAGCRSRWGDAVLGCVAWVHGSSRTYEES